MSMLQWTELFLDLYGNVMITDWSSKYLDEISVEISRLITEHSKNTSVLTPIIDFSHLRYQERDEVEDIVWTWHSKFPFDIEQAWDQRLWYYFAERYDHRANLVDWDFTFNIDKYITKMITFKQYKNFRVTGNAFEFRLS